MRISLMTVAVAFSALAATGAQAPVAQRLVGAWELVNYEITAADGTKRPGAYDRGQITYDSSGRMSAQLMNSANTADAAPNTDELRAAAYRRYLGYYGPFVVDEARGFVTHIVGGLAAGARLRAVTRHRSTDADAEGRVRPRHAVAGLEAVEAVGP